VKGQDAGQRALFAAATVALKYVIVTKPAVQTAVCLLIRGIRAVGKIIAQREIFVALEKPDVVLMSGNAVETLV
jgi:hypothetical protein